jgi:hypothetical protein
MARFGSFGVALGALMLAPAGMLVAPGAMAQVQTTGRNVTAVTVDAGPGAQFVKQGPDRWAELDARGRPVFYYRERARDAWSVYLVDTRRGIELQLDLHRRKVTITDRGRPRRDLYAIIRVTHNGSNYDVRDRDPRDVRDRDSRDVRDRDWRDRDGRDRWDDRGDSRSVEVGPLWNQRDAETKCRAKAAELRGEWTGQWHTTVPGRMSVCEIRVGRGGGWDRDRDRDRDRDSDRGRGRDVVRNIDVGPIWNQRDAESKCRAKAGELRAEWTGQWRTTIAGRASECEIRFR